MPQITQMAQISVFICAICGEKIEHISAMNKFWPYLFLLLILAACGDDEKQQCAFIPDTGNIQVSFQFESLEDSLPAIQTKDQLVGFLTRHPQLRDGFFNRQGYPDDSTYINELFNRFTHPAVDSLLMETHRVFGNGEELKKQFEAAFKNIKYYYPDFKAPTIQTVISGLETDVMVTDSLVLIGLDYFLGADARFKPNMYEYMQKRYHKDFVVPSVVLLMGIDGRTNKTNPEDKTVLADMVAYGKAYAFTKRMLPCTPDSVLIGYTQKETDGALVNEATIWKRMIQDQVLFGTSHMTKQKYIAERPKTSEISAQCPGRIGMWVGWRIADYYLYETGKPLPELMAEPDAQKIFKLSKYKPGN
jgi:hypothetical protein